jgi:Cu+-exporting ATPase
VINQEAVLKVGGMVCATCVETIETRTPGTSRGQESELNLGTEKAYVTINPSVTSLAEMKAAIEDAGYQYLGIAGELSEDAERKIREKDLREKFWRFTIGFAVSIALFLLMVFPVALPVPMPYFQLVISAPVFVYVTYPIFRAARMALRNRSLNMDVMYAMGVGVAFTAIEFPRTFKIVLTRSSCFTIPRSCLPLSLTHGRYLDARAKGRTSDAIRKLVGLHKNGDGPSGGPKRRTSRSKMSVVGNSFSKNRAGVPVDGVVYARRELFDESMNTGEPSQQQPRSRRPGGWWYDLHNRRLTDRAKNRERDRARPESSACRGCAGFQPPIQKIADLL